MKDSKNNVISLSKDPKRPQTRVRQLGEQPSAVEAVIAKASSHLSEQAKQVFSKVDDSLFAMAEKAHVQGEQDDLFHALRLLRVERRHIVERFTKNFSRGFEREYLEKGPSDDPYSSDNLSLIHNDDLEQLVAVDTMVAAAKRDFAEPLTELALRLNALLPVKIYDKNNPLGPDAICDAFVEAVREVDLYVGARLVVLKKFEQLLMAGLGELYKQCNDHFIECGVLSSLKQPRPPVRPVASPAGQRPQSARATGEVASQPSAKVPTHQAPPYSSNVAQSQPAPQHGGQGGHVQGEQGATSGWESSQGLIADIDHDATYSYGLLPLSSGVMPMTSQDLLGHLDALQGHEPAKGAAGDAQLVDVSSLLQERLVEAHQSSAIAKVDSEIIKLVEMLFSFILEDRNLADPIKYELSRLQLPLLKVAIADKSFFSKGGHPARKLLNELADACTGWQAGESYVSDPLFSKVREVVTRVVEEFGYDVNIFSLLHESFLAFIERERKRAEKLEQRIVDEADGKAKSQAARARVAAVIDALTADRDLPPVVTEWLEKVWSHVLFLTCIKDGTDSENWSRDVRTARDLVWSVEAPMPQSRQQLIGLLPALQGRLKVGVEAVSLPAFEARRMFGELKTVYGARFALAQKVAPAAEVDYSSVLAGAQSGQAPADGDAADAGQGMPDGVAELPEMEALEQAVADVETQAQAQAPAEDSQLPDSDACWQQTFRLAQGSWFQLKQGEGEQFRCRLAAVITDIDQFIFVNRNGAKVAEFTRLELANALRVGTLKPLDDGMLFERALQSVIGTVRASRNEMH